MFKKFKKIIRRTLERGKLYIEAIHDANRYFHAASWAGPCDHHKLTHLESDIIKHYHVLEKTVSMPDFRPKSGKDILSRLIVLLRQWESEGGAIDSVHYLAAQDAIQEYFECHIKIGVDVSDLIPDRLYKKSTNGSATGGSKPPVVVAPEELAIFDKVALSRHSVRAFNPERIPSRSIISDAIRIAISAPSVCNRQTWRVHFYEGNAAQEVLALQNGNRGFGHLIPTVAVITIDMRYFSGGGERYQPWIEGGIFSMNFMLALHARGIATVALNWSRLTRDDLKMHVVANIPAHERVVMLIGMGYTREGHAVPYSQRNTVNSFMTWHSTQ